MKGLSKCLFFGVVLSVASVPVVTKGDDYSLDVLQPGGGDPAPAANPPVVELLFHGGHLSRDAIHLTIDGIQADLEPALDGIDNDGDGLVDEAGEGIVTYPSETQTRLLARWPWSLMSDDPATLDVNEGIHMLDVRVRPPVGDDIERAVRFAVYTHGGLDSLIVYPSPFDPAEEKARVAFRTLIEGRIRIEILDFQGHTVKDIADWVPLLPGWHQDSAYLWDGRDNDGDVVGNGVYFVRVVFKAGTFTEERIEKCFLAH